MRLLVVGTGPAGITAAATARRLDPTARITVLSAEPYPPYSPPAMADHFLTGRDETLFWQQGLLQRLGIEERREAVVASLDTDAREAVLRSGERIPYDAAVLASGSRLYAPVEGAQLEGVLDFKSLQRANALVGRVRRGEVRTALVVGAGLIGVELCLLLAALGVETTVLEREAFVMPRVLDPETAAVVEDAVRRAGVVVRTGTAAEAFVGNGSVTGVRLGSGEFLRADLYVAATGVKPHVEFLEGSGVASGWGVAVDERLETSVPGVYAAGDVAETADVLTGERYVHAIFPNAVAQGRVAGANAVGGQLRYEGAEAMNSLKHLGVPVIAIGRRELAEDVLRRRDRQGLRLVYLASGRIVGAQVAGDTRPVGWYRSLMLRRADVGGLGALLVASPSGFAEVAHRVVGRGVVGRGVVGRGVVGRGVVGRGVVRGGTPRAGVLREAARRKEGLATGASVRWGRTDRTEPQRRDARASS